MGFDLMTLVWFIVALAILIAVHEYGHYWVAVKSGVKVLRFSIGFGKPLYRKRLGPDQTEFVVAAIPLGGYVKMLDEREGEVPQAESHRAFNNKSLKARTAVVAAGPLFNLAFAVLAFWAMYMVGVSGTRPIVGDVQPGTYAASAGFENGEEIVSVDGESTPTWKTAIAAILEGALDDGRVEVTVLSQKGYPVVKDLDMGPDAAKEDPSKLIKSLGLKAQQLRFPAMIDKVVPDGAAEKAGLQAGDEVVAADGARVEDWSHWVDIVRSKPDQSIAIEVQRDGRQLPLTITPQALETEEGTIGRIGALARVPPEMIERLRVEVSYGPIDAFLKGVEKTGQSIRLLITVLGKMLMGEASVKNISGPVSIAQFAGMAAEQGMSEFLGFLALISISLGVLNLLPVPILDGGHLLYYLIEFLKGSPLSEAAQIVGQKVGIAVLMGLMSLAFYNDFVRLFGAG